MGKAVAARRAVGRAALEAIRGVKRVAVLVDDLASWLNEERRACGARLEAILCYVCMYVCSGEELCGVIISLEMYCILFFARI